MTSKAIRDLVLWMKSEGVQQFATDKLSVVFHPRAVNTGAQADAPANSTLSEAVKLTGDLDIETLMPSVPDMPDAEVPRQ